MMMVWMLAKEALLSPTENIDALCDKYRGTWKTLKYRWMQNHHSVIRVFL